jgi:UDP-glucose 4-epimerase
MGKHILVTGGAGFIGSNLCRRLKADGHTITSLDNYFTGVKENHIEGVEYREGHTKDIATHIPETPDLIYHLGEYSRVEKSFTEPDVVWDLNVAGTFAVLEFCRLRGSKLVYAGSSTKFADGGLGRDESPYAYTKASNTELVRNYGLWFKIPYAITYFYNVYGPGERAGAYGTLIEIFRQKHIVGEPLTVRSPGTQKRNFTHVDDIIAGLVLVGEKGEGDDFGIGDERAHTVLEVADMFGGEVVMAPNVPGNRMGSTIDTSEVRSLGWEPKHALVDYVQSVTSGK